MMLLKLYKTRFFNTTMTLDIVILYGSVRSDRQGIKAARFIENKLKERGHEVHLVDPKVYDLPLLDKMYKELKDPPAKMQELAALYKKTDAFVIVTGEYNHSIPPALKNLIDHYMEEYFFKPSAIVSYSAGGFGGVRAAMALRVILPEVGMSSIPSMFPISKVQDSFDDSGKDLEGRYDKTIGKFFDELEWYANALKAQRNKGNPY